MVVGADFKPASTEIMGIDKSWSHLKSMKGAVTKTVAKSFARSRINSVIYCTVNFRVVGVVTAHHYYLTKIILILKTMIAFSRSMTQFLWYDLQHFSTKQSVT